MAWELSEDECYGVMIAVNSILHAHLGIEEGEDWSLQHDTWWGLRRREWDGRSAEEVIWEDPDKVVRMALRASPRKERARRWRHG